MKKANRQTLRCYVTRFPNNLFKVTHVNVVDTTTMRMRLGFFVHTEKLVFVPDVNSLPGSASPYGYSRQLVLQSYYE